MFFGRILAVAVTAAIAWFGPGAVLGTLGFTSSGISAGSIAALVQSVVYGGFTAGIFAVFQGVGAGGISLPIKVAIVAVFVGIGIRVTKSTLVI